MTLVRWIFARDETSGLYMSEFNIGNTIISVYYQTYWFGRIYVRFVTLTSLFTFKYGKIFQSLRLPAKMKIGIELYEFREYDFNKK